MKWVVGGGNKQYFILDQNLLYFVLPVINTGSVAINDMGLIVVKV